MQLRTTLIGALVAGMSLMASPAPAQVDLPGPGRITTSAFGPVPAVAVSVRALDDSPNNLKLKENFESGLTSRNWRVARGNAAPLRLDFEIEFQPLGARVPGTSRLVRPGPITEPEGAFRRGTQTENTVIIGEPPDGRGGLRYVITASINDQASGRQLWQGEISYDGVPTDEQAVLRAMIPILLDRIGKTVRREPFKLN